MHIGLVIYGRLDTLSGGYLYDRKLVAHLRAHGDTVEIVSLPWQTYGRHLLHNVSSDLYRRLRAAPFDLLLQDELNHPSLAWLNRRLRGRVRYPLVSIVHHLRCSEAHPAWQNWLYRRVERAYLRSVDGFVCNSKTTCTAVADLRGPLGPHVIAYPAGDRLRPQMDDAAIVARAQAPGPLRLLFVGNLIARKGLHTLLAALAPLPRDAWRLDVVGNTAVAPAYTRRIKRQIAADGLGGQVTLHGALADAALAELLGRSHVLAVPSRYEGFGIVYLEGMGFGLPAIATTAGAAHEIVSDGVDGFLVPAGDAAVLRSRIATLHRDRAQLTTMGLAARRRYAAHPTWDESMGRVREFLQEMVGAGGGRPSSSQ